MTVVTPTDRSKSVRNRSFGGVFVLSRCFWIFSVVVGAFVIRLSQISSFFFQCEVNLKELLGGYDGTYICIPQVYGH